MQWINLHEIASSLKWGFAGLVGAAVASRFHKDEIQNRIDLAVFIASGAFTAHYCTGMIAQYLEFSKDSAGAIGFLLGAFGGSILQVCVKIIRSGDLWNLIKGRIGGGS